MGKPLYGVVASGEIMIDDQILMNALGAQTLPTTDGRELLLVRRTEPDKEVALLLQQLDLVLPPQPPPKICRPSATM